MVVLVSDIVLTLSLIIDIIDDRALLIKQPAMLWIKLTKWMLFYYIAKWVWTWAWKKGTTLNVFITVWKISKKRGNAHQCSFAELIFRYEGRKPYRPDDYRKQWASTLILIPEVMDWGELVVDVNGILCSHYCALLNLYQIFIDFIETAQQERRMCLSCRSRRQHNILERVQVMTVKWLLKMPFYYGILQCRSCNSIFFVYTRMPPGIFQ